MTPLEKELDKQISRTYKALAKKLTQTIDIEIQSDISEQMSTLLTQRIKLAKRTLGKSSKTLNSVIEGLKELTLQANQAKRNVDEIEAIIKKSSKVVDKVTQFISGLAKAAVLL